MVASIIRRCEGRPWDWGSAITRPRCGAASTSVNRSKIAEVSLLENGAPPTLFSSTMPRPALRGFEGGSNDATAPGFAENPRTSLLSLWFHGEVRRTAGGAVVSRTSLSRKIGDAAPAADGRARSTRRSAAKNARLAGSGFRGNRARDVLAHFPQKPCPKNHVALAPPRGFGPSLPAAPTSHARFVPTGPAATGRCGNSASNGPPSRRIVRPHAARSGRWWPARTRA